MIDKIYSTEHPHNEIQHYDVLILGAGPAGLTAALYAGRYNLTTAVIAKSIGGTTNLAGELENWPGFIGSGIELMKNFKEQAEKFGAKFLEAEVKLILKDENGFIFLIDNKVIHGKSLIISLGTEHKKLNIPGEKEFLGKGVSYCATCDGMFFKNKNVAVIGGSDSAAKAALYLNDIAKKVYVIYRGNEMRCEPIVFDRLKKKHTIEILYNTIPLSIDGLNLVKSMSIEVNKQKEKLDIDGVFIEVGATPVTDIVRTLKVSLDKDGQIITNKKAQTNVPGVFAAGDATDNYLKQVVTAAAEGAIAAKSVQEYLKFEYKEKPEKVKKVKVLKIKELKINQENFKENQGFKKIERSNLIVTD